MAPLAFIAADSACDLREASGGRLAWEAGTLAAAAIWMAWLLLTGRADTPGRSDERRGLGLQDRS